MSRTKYFVFPLILLVNIIAAVQIQAQTSITFTEFPIDTKASESYASKGVLFSSFGGTPTISKDRLITQKRGLCAEERRNIVGYICGDIEIVFVSPEQKMITNLASDIKIKFLGVGGVTAIWLSKDNNEIYQEEASLDANNDLSISIPMETYGIQLISTDSDCIVCNFTITNLSFTLSRSADLVCDRPVTDPSYSFRRLINEDYPQEIYDRLDEYKKPGHSLDIGLQYLKTGKITYYDEFAIIVNLPNDERNLPQKMFMAMRRKLDTVGIGDAAKRFREIGEFSYFEPPKVNNRKDGIPVVGDIYHVNIIGPDDGDVMITDLYEHPVGSRFRYSTLNN